VPQIAERAGVSRRTTQIAIKRAKSLGLIAVEDIPGGKHAIANRYVRTYRGGGQSSD
jgi:DNA-binding transcriptional regulator LsrR (DeoR family)